MDEIEKALRSAATLLEALRLDNNVGQILGPQEREIYRAVEDLVKAQLQLSPQYGQTEDSDGIYTRMDCRRNNCNHMGWSLGDSDMGSVNSCPYVDGFTKRREIMKWYEEFERELERKRAEREREARMFAKERGESVEAWRADVTADDPGLEPDGEEN